VEIERAFFPIKGSYQRDHLPGEIFDPCFVRQNQLTVHVIDAIAVMHWKVSCTAGTAHQEHTVVITLQDYRHPFKLNLLPKSGNFSSFLLYCMVSDSPPRVVRSKICQSEELMNLATFQRWLALISTKAVQFVASSITSSSRNLSHTKTRLYRNKLFSLSTRLIG
jgi:hypothetical protein